MKFLIDRDSLYKTLQKVVHIISNKPRLSILSHILLEINKNDLFITATDLEIEIVAQVPLEQEYPTTSITISGRKFFEICRNLSKHTKITVTFQNNKVIINSEHSTFALSALSALDFPKIKEWSNKPNIVLPQSILRKMIKLTQFAMGNQDARFYLNGVFFETNKNTIRVVATDGYKLAMCEIITDILLPSQSIIIPRKGILEILHLLNTTTKPINIQIHENYISMKVNNYICNSKLIDASFPNYRSVFSNQLKNIFEIERLVLQQALKRASILSNDRLRIVNLCLTNNQLKISAHNFEQEVSEEILKILYSHKNIEISFNVDYLLDVINTINTQILKFSLIDEVSGMQIEGIPQYYGSIYIVMPIKI